MWAYAALAGVQIIGGYQQAAMIRKSADIKAGIDAMNAKYIDIDAYNASTAGVSAGARQDNSTNQVVAKQRAALAGSGVSVDYGTAADIQADSKVTGMLNTLELQRQGREKALGYKVQAINTRLGSTMAQTQSDMDAAAAQSKGIMSAASTAISGYDRSLSTGKGVASKSGDSGTPTYGSSLGGSMAAPSQQPTWFYGDEPRSYYSQPTVGSQYAPSDRSLFSNSNWGFGG